MNFSFVQVTDHHLTASESVLTRGFSTNYSFRAVMRHIAEHAGSSADSHEKVPSFVVSTGDLGETDPPGAYRAALKILRAQGGGLEAPGPIVIYLDGLGEIPMYFLPGNHDDLPVMLEHFFPGSHESGSTHGSAALANLWFEHAGVRFICLDWGRGDKAISSPELFDTLSAGLEDGRPAVILTHHHVAPIGVPWLDEFIADDIDRLWKTVRGKNVLGVLSGHVHMTTETIVEGIPVLTLRSTAFQFAQYSRPLITLEPPHYRVVTIAGGVLSSRVVEVAI